MSPEIRLATLADVEEINSFDEFGGDRNEEVEAKTCLVATAGGRTVGYASYARRGLLGQPLLNYLCVREPFRRQGVATSLVAAIQAAAHGRMLVSSTEAWCTGTRRIFTNLGWQAIGSISGVNKDGSVELFYAIKIDA